MKLLKALLLSFLIIIGTLIIVFLINLGCAINPILTFIITLIILGVIMTFVFMNL